MTEFQVLNVSLGMNVTLKGVTVWIRLKENEDRVSERLERLENLSREGKPERGMKERCK